LNEYKLGKSQKGRHENIRGYVPVT